MSADNFIAIVKNKKGQFEGYNCSASCDYKKISDYKREGSLYWTVDTLDEAIDKAQAEYTEYGFYFVNK